MLWEVPTPANGRCTVSILSGVWESRRCVHALFVSSLLQCMLDWERVGNGRALGCIHAGARGASTG